MQQTPASDKCNQSLLKAIPLSARRVVEVGCSSGALAREYKKLNPQCHYIGIEIDASYAAQATEYCDEVHCLNIEQLQLDEMPCMHKTDCWIFGDTLEHLVNPWQTLKNIRVFMNIDSTLLACIPNAQHWSVQARLFTGMFVYEDKGLLDKTHLRWFTRKTIISLFESTGYHIQSLTPRVFNEPGLERLKPGLIAMAKAIGCDPQMAIDEAAPLQYVISATIASSPSVSNP